MAGSPAALLERGVFAEPRKSFEHIESSLAANAIFEGEYAIITAGPTQEALIPFRYISNRSKRQDWVMPSPRPAARRGAQSFSSPSR